MDDICERIRIRLETAHARTPHNKTDMRHQPIVMNAPTTNGANAGYRTHLAGHDSSGAFILRYICSLVLPFETKLTRLTTTDEQYDALKPIEDL